jgi:hypothetical protein
MLVEVVQQETILMYFIRKKVDKIEVGNRTECTISNFHLTLPIVYCLQDALNWTRAGLTKHYSTIPSFVQTLTATSLLDHTGVKHGT